MRRYDFPPAYLLVPYLFRFQAPRCSPRSCSLARFAGSESPPWRPGLFWLPATPGSGLFSRGRDRDLSGSLVILPVPLPCSNTPAGSLPPGHYRRHRCCPQTQHTEGPSDQHDFEAYHTASTHAVYASRAPLPTPMQDSLPADWLGLCREGFEPSGSLRKVSVVTSHPPPQGFP